MTQISPPSRESEFFGFYILSGKVGAIIAILLFGVISSGTGNQRTAVLWLLPLFVVGLAGRFELVPLSESFEWLASWPALVGMVSTEAG